MSTDVTGIVPFFFRCLGFAVAAAGLGSRQQQLAVPGERQQRGDGLTERCRRQHEICNADADCCSTTATICSNVDGEPGVCVHRQDLPNLPQDSGQRYYQAPIGSDCPDEDKINDVAACNRAAGVFGRVVQSINETIPNGCVHGMQEPPSPPSPSSSLFFFFPAASFSHPLDDLYFISI